VQVAVAVCEPWSRLIVAAGVELPEGRGAWSGWCDLPASGASVELGAVLPTRLADLGDVYLLSRQPDDTPGPESQVVWEKVTVDVMISNGVAPGRIQRESTLVPVTLETLRTGELLSDAADFPYPVYVPAANTLLHPLPGRLALVRLPAALPAGRSGLRAIVSVQHDDARPIDFALWLRPASAGPPGETAQPRDAGFSGWHRVPAPWVRHQLAARLPAPAEAALDVYLATRVDGHPDVHFCHAYWHELWTIRKAAPRGS
jgi:hypothetical protein